MPRQNRFVGQRVNIRTQGGDKPNIGQKGTDPSYLNTNGDSTVFSSLQAGIGGGNGNHNSVYTKQTNQTNIRQANNTMKHTEHSYDSRTPGLNNSGIITPGGQNGIRLPSLQNERSGEVVNVSI